jgi:hypothetical protein
MVGFGGGARQGGGGLRPAGGRLGEDADLFDNFVFDFGHGSGLLEIHNCNPAAGGLPVCTALRLPQSLLFPPDAAHAHSGKNR